MFQTLVIIASIVVLSAAILTSTIVTAKNALHQVVVAKTQTAMHDATSQFQFWAQKFVAQYGTEANWDASGAQAAPIFQSMCVGVARGCNYYETLQWKVTGATSGVPVAVGSPGQTMSTAENMTPAVDEQRISATITAIVSDAQGRTLYGGRSEEVTARVFDVAPYVVVTGTRDLASEAGTTKSSEGDSGGTVDKSLKPYQSSPTAAQPDAYTNTLITATIECANTIAFDENRPEAPSDDGTSLFDPKYHPDGSLMWAYQMPCTPQTIPTAPSGAESYSPPTGSTYIIYGSQGSSDWQKGDGNTSSFAR